MKYQYYGLFDPRNDIVLQNLYDYDWGKQLAYYFSNFNLFGINPVAMYDNANRTADYLKNHGMNWNDVIYPSKLYGAGNVGSAGLGAVNFVSDNVKRLYQ